MFKFIAVCVMMAQFHVMTACNVCSCAAMGNAVGILPNFQSHFIGFRETIRTSVSRHPASILNPEGSESHEKYYYSELWGRWYPHPRVQVFGFLPYVSLSSSEKEEVRKKTGLGDASILVNYMLYATPDSSRSKWRHVLLAGGGAKLPTGTYSQTEEAGFQTGTGSFDWNVQGSYTIRYGKAGMMSENNFRRTGTNSGGYSYGNRFSSALMLFMLAEGRGVSLMPSAGLFHEQVASDRLNGKMQDHTGGQLTAITMGADMFAGNFRFGASVFIPYSQNIGEGSITESPRMTCNLVWHFTRSSDCK